LYDSNGTIINKGWWKKDEYIGSYMEYIKERIQSFSGIGGSSPIQGSNPVGGSKTTRTK